jgi:hypothetical protein
MLLDEVTDLMALLQKAAADPNASPDLKEYCTQLLPIVEDDAGRLAPAEPAPMPEEAPEPLPEPARAAPIELVREPDPPKPKAPPKVISGPLSADLMALVFRVSELERKQQE